MGLDLKTRQSLFQRSMDALEQGRPELGAEVISRSVDCYTDPRRLEQEKLLFARRPQPFAPASALQAPGDWVAATLMDVPVLATRGADGRLRAFLNVCRHRGARVVTSGCGHDRDRFQCPYHAWAYASDGHLAKVPKEWGFPGLNRSERGLRPLAVAEHAGAVWVVVDPDYADVDVTATLGPLATELDGLEFGSYVPRGLRTFTVQANWKLIIDGTLEAYHFKIAHRETVAPLFADNLQVVDEFGLNRRLYLVREQMRERAQSMESLQVLRECGSILYYFFPAGMLLVHSDHAQLMRVVPTGIATSEVQDCALIPAGSHSERAEQHWNRNIGLFQTTLDEDFALMESIQAGLNSKANEALLFGRFEQTIARFHTQLDEELSRLAARPDAAG